MMHCAREDETHLKESDTCVRILQSGDTSVWIEGLEGLLLHVFEFDKMMFMRNPKLLQDDCNLPGVGSRLVGVDDQGLECRHCAM